MSFKFGYIHVNRQGNISDFIISHYKYNTRATPGRSQLSIHIKESLFKYLFIYLYIGVRCLRKRLDGFTKFKLLLILYEKSIVVVRMNFLLPPLHRS